MPETIHAAGAVLVRGAGHADAQVAVIHRPHRADWTLPKGKVDPGELLPTTAVREVLEESGLTITLGAPLAAQHYLVGDAPKTVSYWRANSVSGEFIANDEVDELRWLPVPQAQALLSYGHDRLLVEQAAAAPDTVPLLLVRHAHAGDGETWRAAGRDDAERPLTARGLRAAVGVESLARAFGVRQVITSPALRCTQTVAGLREFAAWREDPWIQDGADIATDGFAKMLARAGAAPEPVAVCTHGEQVDWLVGHFGLDPFKFNKGGVLVLHRRADDLSLIVAREWYPPLR